MASFTGLLTAARPSLRRVTEACLWVVLLHNLTHFTEASHGLILFRATSPQFRAVEKSWVGADEVLPTWSTASGGEPSLKCVISYWLHLAGNAEI